MPIVNMTCVLIPATLPVEAFKDEIWYCAKCGWDVEAGGDQTSPCRNRHVIDLSRLPDFEPLDADNADEDSSGSEDEDADDDDDDDQGSIVSFIDDSEEAVDWKEELDKSGSMVAMERDVVFDTWSDSREAQATSWGNRRYNAEGL